MEASELHRLGRRLEELSRATTASEGDPVMTPGEQAVLEDVLTHPGSTVREISERTGFVQSHVSASVAKLHTRGLVTRGADQVDRRCTRVEPNPAAVAAITNRAARDIEPTLLDSLGAERVARAVELLDELADLVLAPRR
ncbi:MAG: MarR family winged helix-turn-helix transcriptional regulator [Nocardioidaceae bacterium]